jgi:hypothetical protein
MAPVFIFLAPSAYRLKVHEQNTDFHLKHPGAYQNYTSNHSKVLVENLFVCILFDFEVKLTLFGILFHLEKIFQENVKRLS